MAYSGLTSLEELVAGSLCTVIKMIRNEHEELVD